MTCSKFLAFLIVAFFFILNSLGYSAQILGSGDHFNTVIVKYDSLLTEMVESRLPGAAVAIVKDKKIVFLKGYGVRQVGSHEPIDEHTVFRIGSVSKGFAPVLTGLLVEDGVLHWDDKVNYHLKNFSLKDSAHTKEVTIRHILSHTTGVQEHAFTSLLDANVPYEKIIKEIDQAEIVCEVGTCFSYQNVIYSLIADIVKSAAGRDYKLLLNLRIFWPLQMSDTSLGWDAIKSSQNRATPHIRYRRKWVATKIRKAYYSVPPAAGVNASISDMAKWLRALLGGTSLIPPEVLQEVSQPVIRTSKMKRYLRSWKNLKKAWYGLGWRVFDYAGTKIIHHGGYVRGYRAEMAFAPEEGVGIVVLLNSSTRFADVCVPIFFDLYFGL